MSGETKDFTLITPTAEIADTTHGGRAKCLQRLVRLEIPVPRTVSLSFEAVHQIADGHRPDTARLLSAFGRQPLVSVRPSSEDPDWGGPGAVLNIGMNDERRAQLAEKLGQEAADALYLRFIIAYASDVARLDPEPFEEAMETGDPVAAALAAYDDEAGVPFPQDPAKQLAEVLRSMARAWEGVSARLLRQARGAPVDAGLGLVVQDMAHGLGAGESGSGIIRMIDKVTGAHQITGRYRRKTPAMRAMGRKGEELFLALDPRGTSMQDEAPELFDMIVDIADKCRHRLREEMEIKFTISEGQLRVLDAVRVQRGARANVNVAVALAEDGIISPREALLRVEPSSLTELLHTQVDPEAERDVILSGIAASPGGATGRLVFTARAAQTSASHEIPCILVRRETTPEDIRGMHAAQGIITERGGMTSHAAVIARGLGLPCVVGASGMQISVRKKTVTTADGRVFQEGDLVTLDGSAGKALAGAVPMLEPSLDEPFRKLMSWADEVRDIGIRANADTPQDAHMAHTFNADGIGLCRTEHMFFEPARLMVMREMIFTDNKADRQSALEQLLPMQREDFVELFRIMAGLPVCIRLFDPPLHEFLPSDREGLMGMAESLDLPLSDVTRRVESLSEFNPMLGMRGVRLGVTVPEIYDMQVRAIFEATVEASQQAGKAVVPEVMIPLVSAKREVELVKARIDAVAAAVRIETGVEFAYRLGVMVETPRAALRASEIASHASFLSFGTNDLTQMTYGLSRDDAGRFMGTYVSNGVFPEDPFHTLDKEGVGELLELGAARGRTTLPGIVLSVCGEHGGDPDTIAFCRQLGFDYVSCSPFRVPVARLAAAHLALKPAKPFNPEV
ncbi:putative PEP-binding protein [Tropicimonas sp. TH_r6]|uniref:putative PEP-binding protein n=1 Tax=Tropicimonas sp. TH_r6 TaxID=3082085 RepID=UPI002954D404|nr:putative PEP-binding protein [Tropicimonas sp. TH_r6]MDV7145152.1 putative PEP-binding protein [Tropicimonas sp. TH_r6]